MKYLCVIFFFVGFNLSFSQNQNEIVFLRKYNPIFESIMNKAKVLGADNGSLQKEINLLINKNKDTYFQTRMKLLLAELYSNSDLKATKKILTDLHNYIIQHPEYHHLKIHFNNINNIILESEGKYDEAIKACKENTKYFTDFKEFEPIWKLQNTSNVNLINNLIMIGKDTEALQNLIKFEKEAPRNEVEYYCFLLGSISSCYSKSKDYSKSILYLKKAESILEPRKDYKELLSSIYFLHGMNSLRNKDTINSLVFYKKSYSLAKKVNHSLQMVRTGENLAQLYVDMNKMDEAEKNIKEITIVIKKTGLDNEKNYVNKILAESYLKSDKIKQGLGIIDSVNYYFKKNTGNDVSMLKKHIDVLNIKSKLLEKDKNFKDAYSTQLQLSELKDKAIYINDTTRLQQTIVAYETKKKDDQIMILKQKEVIGNLKINKQKSLIISLTIGLILILILILLFVFYKRKIDRIDNLSMRSSLTRMQFNPHYINNAFATLQASLVEKQFDEKIIDYTSHVARFSRLLLESTFQQEWSLFEEKQIIENYLKTQQYRLNHGFEFSLFSEFSKEEMQKIKTPSVITQTVLENAIEHGGFSQDGGGKIDILFHKDNNNLNIVIKNNIVGESTNKNKKLESEPSRGLEITRQRLELYSKIYKHETILNFIINDNEAIITFELPIIYI